VTCKDGQYEVIGASSVEFGIETMKTENVRTFDGDIFWKQAEQASDTALQDEASQYTIGEFLTKGTFRHPTVIGNIPVVLHLRALMLARA